VTGGLEHLPPSALRAGPSTPGMARSEAVSTSGMWSGLVHTEAGASSGWHHHGSWESTIYVVSGVLRMEFADGTFDASAGEFVYVPAGVVHRELNPTSATSEAVVVRATRVGGEAVVNVDGPPS
jgi:uncharacterized RmlC-like cupin family protein